MKLLIDIGNTRIKWAQYKEGQLHYGEPQHHQDYSLDHLFNTLWKNIPTPQSIVAANVAGTLVMDRLTAWAQQTWGLPVHFIKSKKKFGNIINAYENAEQLGIDRLLNLVAARFFHPEHCVAIISAGTALTVDVLNKNNQHEGGLIAPGFGILQHTMNQLLPYTEHYQLDCSDLFAKLGRSTPECIQAGVQYMCIGFVNQAISQIQQTYGKETGIYLTGGNAKGLLPYVDPTVCLQPFMTLQGLAVMSDLEQDNNSR
ncbi:MAG: type III pantothenate kinase [Legionellales bacterium]|nr:type III pantothenate kinase [Legionellales bacterium]